MCVCVFSIWGYIVFIEQDRTARFYWRKRLVLRPAEVFYGNVTIKKHTQTYRHVSSARMHLAPLKSKRSIQHYRDYCICCSMSWKHFEVAFYYQLYIISYNLYVIMGYILCNRFLLNVRIWNNENILIIMGTKKEPFMATNIQFIQTLNNMWHVKPGWSIITRLSE